MSLHDCLPIVARDPFADGARLPDRVTTRNSLYAIREHALHVGEEPMCTVSCEAGTFAGQSWHVPVADVHLTREHLHVRDGFTSTAPIAVDGMPVATWAVEVVDMIVVEISTLGHTQTLTDMILMLPDVLTVKRLDV